MVVITETVSVGWLNEAGEVCVSEKMMMGRKMKRRYSVGIMNDHSLSLSLSVVVVEIGRAHV